MNNYLKRIALGLLVIVSIFVITGCDLKKEDTSKEETKKVAEIVGTWAYSDTYIYTFKEDGTGTYDIGSSVKKFTYKTNGNKISITYDGSTASFDTEYSIKDGVLNIKDSFGNDTLYKRK